MKKLKSIWILLFTNRSIVKESNLKPTEQAPVKTNGDCYPEHLYTKKKFGSYH